MDISETLIFGIKKILILFQQSRYLTHYFWFLVILLWKSFCIYSTYWTIVFKIPNSNSKFSRDFWGLNQWLEIFCLNYKNSVTFSISSVFWISFLLRINVLTIRFPFLITLKLTKVILLCFLNFALILKFMKNCYSKIVCVYRHFIWI